MYLLVPVFICIFIVAMIALFTVTCTKKKAVGKSVLAMLFTAVTVLTASTLVYAEGAEGNPQAAAAALIQPEYSAPEAKSTTMIYAFVYIGDYEEAKNLLDEFESSTVYSGEYALCRARIAALNEKYTAAKLLYEKSGTDLNSGNVKKEYKTVCNC